MNNSELADRIASDDGLTKADARKLVDGVFAAIAEAAAKGEEVSLNGFGKFKVKDVPEREGRNPSTGAALKIAASRKLTFSPAKSEGQVERLGEFPGAVPSRASGPQSALTLSAQFRSKKIRRQPPDSRHQLGAPRMAAKLDDPLSPLLTHKMR